jgi:hypothetical protein
MDSDSDQARFGPMHHGFELALDIQSSGLVATVTGRIETVDALIAMFLQVATELRRTGLRQVLVVDHTFGVVPSEEQLRKLIGAIAGQGFDEVRVAYVDARGTAISRMEVGEIIGREHGYECRVFDNESRARIWLHYGE